MRIFFIIYILMSLFNDRNVTILLLQIGIHYYADAACFYNFYKDRPDIYF